jgi:hypothetical protein
MKEKQPTPEKFIVIDIKLSRGLVVVLSCLLVLAALLTFLTLTGGSASASETEAAEPASTGIRQYYLTDTLSAVQGDDVLNACAASYHTASLWEIADPSNQKYNTELGLTGDDGGQGPPTNNYGWVRTGFGSSTSSVPGQANCAIWASNGSSDYGTVVLLPHSWTAGLDDVGVWETGVRQCSQFARVWCIGD